MKPFNLDAARRGMPTFRQTGVPRMEIGVSSPRMLTYTKGLKCVSCPERDLSSRWNGQLNSDQDGISISTIGTIVALKE